MENYYIPEKKIGEGKPKGEKQRGDGYSSWGVFFGVLLTVVLVAIYERAFIDLPRFFDPYYQNCHPRVLSACALSKYETSRIWLHGYLVLPLAILSLFILLATRRWKPKSLGKILITAFNFSVLIIIAHWYVEFAHYLVHYRHDIGIYFILGSIALAFVILIILVERRFHKSKNA